MADHTFDLLAKIVRETRCKPNWTFMLVEENDDPLVLRLVIQINAFDNYNPDKPLSVRHYHPVPITTYNEATWRRWIFDQCIRTMNHELGECLRFGNDEVRPFAPMHGPGEDPYTVHEFRPEKDFLTTQNGKLREGPI